MSKQERTGAWMIALLIAVLLIAVAVEKKCSCEDVSTQDTESLNECAKKAEKSLPKEKTKDTKKGKKKDSNKNKKRDKKSKVKKTSSKPTKRKETTSCKSSGEKNGNSSKQKELQPVPQF